MGHIAVVKLKIYKQLRGIKSGKMFPTSIRILAKDSKKVRQADGYSYRGYVIRALPSVFVLII